MIYTYLTVVLHCMRGDVPRCVERLLTQLVWDAPWQAADPVVHLEVSLLRDLLNAGPHDVPLSILPCFLVESDETLPTPISHNTYKDTLQQSMYIYKYVHTLI
jgi:hypothetical protein